MPTLDWIGKQHVVDHHREVPYRLLKCDSKKSAGDPESGNLLVQGDNLLALKALLPYYAGKVKCIYIDPPYNTGNEGWVYNDNVNSPQIKEWLGKTVGKEAEDLSRHDKWLCMMYPRLKLLREFLREDGVIFVSIDDFEAHRLREITGEIFGQQNFIAQLVWDKTRKNDAKLFSVGHEYALVFAKSLSYLRDKGTVWREQKPGTREILEEWRRLRALYGCDYDAIQKELRAWYTSLQKDHAAKKQSRHKWVDENGPWRDRDISWPGGGGPRYDVLHPVTGKPCKVPERGWGFATSEEMQRQIEQGLVQFRKDHTSPPFRKAHLIPVDAEPDTANEEAGMLVMSSVVQKQAQVSVKLLRELFDGKKVFQNPKDHEVIARFISYVTAPDALILDSFSGSGTTMHAVMALNREDGGNRRCIMVELEETIATDVTSERIRRVMQQEAARDDEGFRYCTLGQPLFDADGQINEPVTFSDLAHHIFFTETGTPLPKRPRKKSRKNSRKNSPLIGTHNGVAYYLLFNGILGDKRANGGNVLTRAILNSLPSPPDSGEGWKKVIYGEATRLHDSTLKRENVTFKQLPYEVEVT